MNSIIESFNMDMFILEYNNFLNVTNKKILNETNSDIIHESVKENFLKIKEIVKKALIKIKQKIVELFKMVREKIKELTSKFKKIKNELEDKIKSKVFNGNITLSEECKIYDCKLISSKIKHCCNKNKTTLHELMLEYITTQVDIISKTKTHDHELSHYDIYDKESFNNKIIDIRNKYVEIDFDEISNKFELKSSFRNNQLNNYINELKSTSEIINDHVDYINEYYIKNFNSMDKHVNDIMDSINKRIEKIPTFEFDNKTGTVITTEQDWLNFLKVYTSDFISSCTKDIEMIKNSCSIMIKIDSLLITSGYNIFTNIKF